MLETLHNTSPALTHLLLLFAVLVFVLVRNALRPQAPPPAPSRPTTPPQAPD